MVSMRVRAAEATAGRCEAVCAVAMQATQELTGIAVEARVPPALTGVTGHHRASSGLTGCLRWAQHRWHNQARPSQ